MLVYKYRNFYEMIEKNAKHRPKETALFIDKRKVSHLRLKQKIDTFARFLEFSAIKSSDKIAIVVANSEEFIVSFLAITKIGAIAVPINTFLKHEELAYIINDAEAKLLISSPEYAVETKDLLNTSPIEKIVWTGEYEKLDEKNYSFLEITGSMETHEQLAKMPSLDDLACIIYTSGTTGKPKGAMLSYRNMFSNMVAGEEVFNIIPEDRFIVYLPMFHSFTLTLMVLLPLYIGSSLVIIKSVFPFSNVMRQTLLRRVTIFLGAPAVYNALLKAKIPWYFMWFNKVRLFISGSAPLNEQAIEDFASRFKRATLLEGYGLSECSPAVAVNRSDKQKALSVGPALPGYKIKIVNDEMVELPLGSVGEIIVKGDCVMKGYYNRPDATDETIVNGWLFTGDLGKMDEDGFLYIVDRKKDLIISKGINVYPREIEEILYKYDGIEACAVIGVKNHSNDEEVIAFIQTKEDVGEIPQKELRQYLKSHLANFKIPKLFYMVEELPKNATGKVLKRVLKEHVLRGDFLLK
ncbi:MAG: long-chain-fatty-acid--CoA ligase [Campylobacteraceae bacterium]|nr:long-chain-fatty-acid--CoA ligase [Campylobacteraceae bacterium]